MPNPRVLLFALLAGCASQPPAGVDDSRLPEKKRTTLGLYVDARGAHEMVQADPEHVRLIDVRTPVEYVYVGHPPMAPNVPFLFMTDEWDPQKSRLKMRPNPRFVEELRGHASPDDTVLLMCRSGGRSASAVEALKQAGFEKVYTVVDGFEGDVEKDRGSSDFGKRTVNGWRNSGLPWTYELDPELVHRDAER